MWGPVPPDLIARLAEARRIVVMTGSGASAESGVPTFREAQTGLWARFRPDELATAEAFAANPERVWNWYAWRRELVARAEPNAGHHALAAIERLCDDFTLITQNVDGLHQRAGSKDPIEFHGNIGRTLCFEERKPVTGWEHQEQVPPRCPDCGAWLRPGVVWFGEAIPPEALSRSQTACAEAEVFLSVGTSSLVYPAADLAETALRAGAVVVEVNVNETPLSSLADYCLKGPSGQVLPALVSCLPGIQSTFG